MAFKMARVHVYHTQIKDEPGGVAARLKPLAEAGANLEYVYSQRSATRQGYGDLYVAPLTAAGHVQAAKDAGLSPVNEPIVMRVEGDDKTGLARKVTQAWEIAGINVHGMVMSVFHGKFVGYVTFDSVQDANKAATLLAELGTADGEPTGPVRNPNSGVGMKS